MALIKLLDSAFLEYSPTDRDTEMNVKVFPLQNHKYLNSFLDIIRDSSSLNRGEEEHGYDACKKI